MSERKPIARLEAGDRFEALVLDIQVGRITLRLPSGESLTARSLILPEARIGEKSVFIVKENVKGQVALEMQKPEKADETDGGGEGEKRRMFDIRV